MGKTNKRHLNIKKYREQTVGFSGGSWVRGCVK